MSTKAKYVSIIVLLVVASALLFLKASFSFHGRLLDQNGDAVAGANIRTHIGGGPIGGGSGIALAKTDVNGYFIISNKSGASLQILDMSRPGYDISTERQPSVFLAAINDYQRRNMPSLGDLSKHRYRGNAFVFSAWKLAAAGRDSELLNGDRRFGFNSGDGPYFIDLTKPQGSMKSKRKERGQLSVEFWNAGDQSAWKMNDWRFEISAPDGGIVETDDTYSNVAPDAGYQTNLQFSRNEVFGEGNYSTTFIRHFYIRNSELTGRISMKFYPVRRNTSTYDGIIAMDYSLNLTGSAQVWGFDGFD